MAEKKRTVTRDKRAKAQEADGKLARLKELIRMLERSTLSELEYEDADIAVTLRRGGSTGAAPAPLPAPLPSAPPLRSLPPGPPIEDKSVQLIRSPFVGTFYRAPSPEASFFVEVGSRVEKGQTVCIVEAMKLMNEIECEVGGTVLEILAENGQAVQYGDALFKVRLG